MNLASDVVNARLYPAGMLTSLSRSEVERLHDASHGDLYELLRRCSLAVLNSGNESDDAEALLAEFRDFDITVEQFNRGIRLELCNAPGIAFVDGKIIEGVRELLSAVIRDLVYYDTEIGSNPSYTMDTGEQITNAVFEILRNANIIQPRVEPHLVVCWGGHSISRAEYEYTKLVGYELGLRKLNVCTGCGPGAMKGPMKGATIGHSKQRVKNGRYIGVTEPGIIAAESPNPIVNELVILPDIEKRLEAFVRLGHGIVVFPGGAGTAEEILYLLGILLHPKNADLPFPVVFTGPAGSAAYFEQIDKFIRLTLGDQAAARYQIIIDDPVAVAQTMQAGLAEVGEFRSEVKDAWYYNWRLQIDEDFQRPFEPTHAAMAGLELHRDLPVHELAANLRRAFSGIVAGNVKPNTLAAIRAGGKFEISGEKAIMDKLDGLLSEFVAQHRMKLPGVAYEPCYRVVSGE
ncbi:LOG family protein [Marinihelvus fidelis]|uniref:AMP nucleosidase n=1 Tax=Marinihelvus fidelis TaxID=2613842 RepID=A0A5N0TAT4_9GAMM|nr:nucleotide 5'-monophosphate nucleosidase PpnN [Marinihelvus fidelis]KAA9132082.1 LOG family protein [Marinihelvus fidelis]